VSVELVRTDPRAPEWDGTADRFTDSVFFRGSWITAVAVGFSAMDFCVVATDDGAPVALCPGVIIRRGPFRVFYSGIPFGGVEGTPEGRRALFERLPEVLASEGVHRIRLQPLPGSTGEGDGYERIPVLFPLLGLEPLRGRDLLDCIAGNPRRDVRRAIREGVEVRTVDGPGGALEFFGLYRMSQARNRAYARYPLQYFEAITDLPCDLAPRFSLALIGGTPAAGMVTVRSGGSVHYLHGGIDYRFRKHCASDLLIFRALETAVSEGADEFDFGGTSPSDGNLLRYKCKWGAKAEEVPVLSLDVSPFMCRAMDMALRIASLRPAWLGGGGGHGAG
jgi:hypothetical protein